MAVAGPAGLILAILLAVIVCPGVLLATPSAMPTPATWIVTAAYGYDTAPRTPELTSGGRVDNACAIQLRVSGGGSCEKVSAFPGSLLPQSQDFNPTGLRDSG